MAEKTAENRPTGSIGTEEKPYKCMLCGKMYRTKGRLKKHIIIHPAEKNIHKCTICGKAFKTETEMTIHGSVHSDEKPYTCTECNAKFKRKMTMINHTRQHRQELCLCELCGNTFKTKQNLANHQVVHSEDRPFKCTKCTLTFKRIVGLIRHQRVHSDEKPYTCDQCGQSFTRLAGLNIHKRPQYQASITAYSCEQCSEIFRYKCGLKAHQGIHAAERKKTNSVPNQHSCQLCGLSYVQKSSLNRHLKTHTKPTSSAQSEGQCDDPDGPTVFTSTSVYEVLLGTQTPTVRGIPYPSLTYLEDTSNVSTVHGAVPKTDSDIQGRRNVGDNPLVYVSATRETEDATRRVPIHSSQSDSGRKRLGGFTSSSLNRPSETNHRDIMFWEEEILQVPVSSIAQSGTQRVAERTTADSGRVQSLVPSDPLEDLADMMDGVEEREKSRLEDVHIINHHTDPHIQQYHHRLQQQQVAEELLQMVKAVTTAEDPITSGRSERMHH